MAISKAVTELTCAKAKPTGADYQAAAGNGLTLLVRAMGAKLWRYEYRLDGKKTKYSYSNYPEISLAQANLLQMVARQLVEMGRHPAELLDSEEAKQQILDGGSLKDAEACAEATAMHAARALRISFGEAVKAYKSGWVESKWKSPDKRYLAKNRRRRKAS